MSYKEMNISPEKILVAIHQQLRIRFFDATKTVARQMFKDLKAGKKLPLLEISSPELGEVAGNLSLDYSDFVGNLTFTAFHDALASHLNRSADKLRNEESLNIFSSADTGAILFNTPGLVQADEQLNALVTGLEQSQPGVLDIRLMFLHPDNFKKKS